VWYALSWATNKVSLIGVFFLLNLSELLLLKGLVEVGRPVCRLLVAPASGGVAPNQRLLVTVGYLGNLAQHHRVLALCELA